jgi:hypothetical protein
MARLTLRHRLARVHPFVWIGAAAVVASLVAWPLGGWDTVELQSTKIPDAAPGETVRGQVYSVRVAYAELTDVNPNGFGEPDPGWTYLVLHVKVTNETASTQFSSDLGDDYGGTLTIDDGALGWGTTALGPNGYTARANPYLESDGTFLPDLQPQLPTDLLLAWDVHVGQWQAGDHLTVGIVDRTPYSCTLALGTCFGQPEVIAHVRVLVRGGDEA